MRWCGCELIEPMQHVQIKKKLTKKKYSKSVKNGHSKIDKTKILLTIGSLMQAGKSIAECSKWSFTCLH